MAIFPLLVNIPPPEIVQRKLLPVEFAMDTEMQSEFGNTTQETLAYYLKSNYFPDICVVNVGIHDMGLKGMTDITYVQNVRSYIGLLVNVCGHIIWLDSTAPKTDNKPQKKWRLKLWNKMVSSMLKQNFSSKVTIISVFDASTRTYHNDNVHLAISWYRSLSHMIVQGVIGAQQHI